MQDECDVKKGYSTSEFVFRLRRLADALESGDGFAIKFAGEKIIVPQSTEFNIEYERDESSEEIEFEIKWSSD
jgi:amphi-Trp domain-containing protein